MAFAGRCSRPALPRHALQPLPEKALCFQCAGRQWEALYESAHVTSDVLHQVSIGSHIEVYPGEYTIITRSSLERSLSS